MRRPAPEVRARLLAWYRAHQRDLPWRRTRDPYAIWVSEIMLQQTRVDTVIPYFQAFIERWPTVTDLANADPGEVRAAWSGLGYYRRASLMLEAAGQVAGRYGGRFPERVEELAALPGFGRYTTGAVASIAFDIEAPAVDGNVARVLARLDGIDGDVTRGEPHRRIWALAETLARGEAPGEYTQAVIELGALVCATKRPKCLLCPVSAACVAYADGTVDRIPAPRPKPRRKAVALTGVVWWSGGEVLLAQQPESGLFPGLWTIPLYEGQHDDDDAARATAALVGGAVPSAEATGSLKHVLTHRDLLIRWVRLSGRRRRVVPPYRWVPLDKVEALGVPSLTVKALRAALTPEELSGTVLPGRRTSRRT